MSVAGDFPAVIEIVQDSELQCELVFVWSEVLTVHGERRIAISYFQISENLIVGSIFFDHVDNVLDRILNTGKREGGRLSLQLVIPDNLLRRRFEVRCCSHIVNLRQRSVHQRWNVRVLATVAASGDLIFPVVRTCSRSLCGRDQQLAALDGARTWIPLRWDKSLGGPLIVVTVLGSVEHRNRIQGGSRDKEKSPV